MTHAAGIVVTVCDQFYVGGIKDIHFLRERAKEEQAGQKNSHIDLISNKSAPRVSRV